MRVTEKGQVTIPQAIRRRLRIEAGSEVSFIERADGAVELVKAPEDRQKALSRSLDDWFSRVEGSGDSGFGSDAITAMTRDSDGDHR